MFTAAGEEFYQIQPLARMGSLKNFTMVSGNLSKLSTNIGVKGIESAMLRLGEPIEYEAATFSLKPKAKEGFNLSQNKDEVVCRPSESRKRHGYEKPAGGLFFGKGDAD